MFNLILAIFFSDTFLSFHRPEINTIPSSCLRILALTLPSAFAHSSWNDCSLLTLQASVQMLSSQKEHNYPI